MQHWLLRGVLGVGAPDVTEVGRCCLVKLAEATDIADDGRSESYPAKITDWYERRAKAAFELDRDRVTAPAMMISGRLHPLA